MGGLASARLLLIRTYNSGKISFFRYSCQRKYSKHLKTYSKGAATGVYTMDVDKFVTKQLELIELEKEADIEETKCLHEKVSTKELEHQGVCIRKVKILEKRSGLFGRTLIKFGPTWIENELPSHHLSSGDIIGVHESGNQVTDVIMSGVIYATKQNSVTVAFETTLENLPLENSEIYSLVKLANDVTYKRIKIALSELKKTCESGNSHLIDVLYGNSEVSRVSSSKEKITLFDKNLNKSQVESVKFALDQREIAIIHGPPGTGKTTTLVEIIRQMVSQNLKILLSAPSNVAIDNLAEKLSSTEVKFVRLGHPARTSASTQKDTLDARLQKCDNANIREDIRKELDSASLAVKNAHDKNERHRKRTEIKDLSRELRTRETAALKEILNGVNVIIATLVSAYPGGPLKQLPKDYFDVVVIDECSQALEAACLIPILQAKKCILAGDHKQLPPTIISPKAAKGGLEITLMERLLNSPQRYPDICRMLTTQYRMHQLIMKLPSKKLYEGKLIAHESVRSHLLNGLPNVETNEDTVAPLLLIDTAGCDFFELDLEDELSKGNEDEANVVVVHLANLIRSGVMEVDIAVITPYNLQVKILRSLISNKYPKVEIRSVDGFQGREKEVVILSFVRSNSKGEVGFLAEERRLNVSITRAKRHLAVICDSETVSNNSFLKEFIEYLHKFGDVRSAHQYLQDMPSNFTHTEIVSKMIAKVKISSTTNTSKPRQIESGKNVQKSGIQNCNQSAPAKFKEMPKEENLRIAYRETLENFKANSLETCYSFPSTLISLERKLVHEIAEKLGLLHRSEGEDDNRRIIVSKRNLKEPQVSKKEKNYEGVGKSISDDTRVCEEIKPEEHSKLDEKQEHLKAAPKKKTKKQKLQNKPKESAENNDDFEAVIEEFTKKDKRCGIETCKINIAVISQTCQFCKKRFCLSHCMPEIHGCGVAVRTEAKKTALKSFERENSTAINSGHKSASRPVLERKLDKKLGELTGKRTRKPPKSNK